MDVFEAVETRFSARAFLPRPVSGDIVRDIVSRARQAPSGGNLQPWFVHALSGEALEDFKALMRRRLKEDPEGEGTEYPVYPPSLWPPYRDRRYSCGMELYAALDIAREDTAARHGQFVRNFEFFGAPVGLFFSIDRGMGAPQWADLGMYLQTVMVLARGHGLHTCPQEAWARWYKTVGAFISLRDDRMLFCGMGLGHIDPDDPVNRFQPERAPLDEFASFRGF